MRSSTAVVEPSVGAVQRKTNPWRRFEESSGFMYLLLAPILVFFILLNVIPTMWMIGLSFYEYSLMSAAPPEFMRHRQLCQNLQRRRPVERLWAHLSLCGAGSGYSDRVGGGAGLPFLGQQPDAGSPRGVDLLFTPMVLTPVASGLFWRLIYEPTFGMANYLRDRFGASNIDFLTNVNWAFPAVLFVDIWMWTPFMILMTLAALGSVPTAELEAAEIDRLSWWKRIWHVIIPHGKFILMLGILLRTIDAFKTTDLVFLMTNGGPGNVTELIGLKLYRYAFASLDMGFSSALALVLLLDRDCLHFDLSLYFEFEPRHQ
jgi:multiple sugar transport system permease protein